MANTKTNTRGEDPVHAVKKEGEKAARKATFNPWMEGLMKVGFAVRGLLYFMIGLLALRVATGSGGALTDQQGAIAAIGAHPGGRILLWVILIGLVGYALWGLVRAIFDPYHVGTDKNGLITRIGYIISGFGYASLVLPTYNLIMGTGKAAHSGAQGQQTQQVAASILTKPWGPWLIGAIGLIGIAGGIFQIYSAFKPSFERQFHPYQLNREEVKWINRIGKFGTAARGVVFALVGFFLFLAAYRSNPGEARGIDGALAALTHQPYGPWLLGIVALGLIAFGLYSILGAVWFRLKRA